MGELLARYRTTVLTVAVLAAVLVGVLVIPGTDGGDDEVTAGGGEQAAETIKIGVALPDLAAFAALSKQYNVGDQEQQVRAVVESWRREGRLPVHGRDIELVIRTYAIVSAEDKTATCQAFAQDDDVFAVIAGRAFTDGATCLAERFGIPVLDTNGVPASAYDRAAPFLFTLQADQNTLFSNLARWAVENDHVTEESRLGLFWEAQLEEAVDDAKAVLAEHGVEPVVDISGSGQGSIGTPQDKVSVQRFQAEGVDVVMPLVGGSSMTAMLTFAEQQGYSAQYLATDIGEQTTDVATNPYPPSQYDGALGITTTRAGEVGAGMELSEATTSCVSDFEAFSGRDIEPSSPEEDGEWSNILLICDLAEVLFAGLEHAGEDLTPESLVAGLEEVEGMELAGHSELSFGPDDHSGVEEFRALGWEAGCTCWTAQGEFQPLE